MAKRRKSRRSGRRTRSSWQKKFGAAGRACFAEGPTSAKMFGKCMKRKLRR